MAVSKMEANAVGSPQRTYNPTLRTGMRGFVTVNQNGNLVQITGSIISDNEDISVGTSLFAVPLPSAGIYFEATSYDKASPLQISASTGSVSPVDYVFRKSIWWHVNLTYFAQ